MLDTLLILYGAFLAMVPAKRPTLNPALEDELMLLRHIRNDA